MNLVPYLHFDGNCEEALNHYKECLGGEIVGIQRYDSAPMDVPENHKNKILHARFRFGNNMIMASDVFPGEGITNDSRVELAINLSDEERTKTIFKKLSSGGTVQMPLEKQFWGALYGKFDDKFGIRWMVNCELKEGA